MITNFLVALMMFFGVNFGQVDHNTGKGKTQKETVEKIIIDDIIGG
jgi:hypothetical protein